MNYSTQLIDIEEATRNRERLALLRRREQAITTTQPIKHKPTYRRTDKGYKRGHYSKTKNKVESVINLYNQGLSIRLIATKLKLAKNTIRKIIAEQSPLLPDKYPPVYLIHIHIPKRS